MCLAFLAASRPGGSVHAEAETRCLKPAVHAGSPEAASVLGPQGHADRPLRWPGGHCRILTEQGSGGRGSCELQSSKYRGEPESAERTSNRDHRAGLCLHGKELAPLSAEDVGSPNRPSARDTWVGDAGWVQRGTQVPAANRRREGGLPHPILLCPGLQQLRRCPPYMGRTFCCSQATDSSVHPGTPSPTHPAYRPSVRAPAVQPSSSVRSNTSLGGGSPVSVVGPGPASPPAPFPTRRAGPP